MTVNDGVHTQLGPGSAGGSVTQRRADQGWSKGCSEEFNTRQLTSGVRYVQNLKKVRKVASLSMFYFHQNSIFLILEFLNLTPLATVF